MSRDSAQRRPIDKHRSDARDTYRLRRRLSPPTLAGPCRPVSDLAHPPPGPQPGRRRGNSAPCTKTVCSKAAPGAASGTIATPQGITPGDTPPPHRGMPDVGSNAHSGRSVANLTMDSRRQSDFVRVRARQSPDPARLRPRSGRFPANGRVRHPLGAPPRRARRGRMYPSGHGQPPRHRRRRVTPQGRSASGGPAKRVDPVTAVAFPACPRPGVPCSPLSSRLERPVFPPADPCFCAVWPQPGSLIPSGTARRTIRNVAARIGESC